MPSLTPPPQPPRFTSPSDLRAVLLPILKNMAFNCDVVVGPEMRLDFTQFALRWAITCQYEILPFG